MWRGRVYDVGISECRGACPDGGVLCHLQRGRGEGVGGRHNERKLGLGCLGGWDGGLGWVDRTTIIMTWMRDGYMQDMRVTI